MTAIERLQSTSEIDAFLARSQEQPVFLFKHSLTCPISSAAFGEFRRFVDQQGGDGAPSPAVFGLIEVQNARDVSNAVATRTGVRHESPQALLFRNGEVVWHASHWTIKVAALEQALATAA